MDIYCRNCGITADIRKSEVKAVAWVQENGYIAVNVEIACHECKEETNYKTINLHIDDFSRA